VRARHLRKSKKAKAKGKVKVYHPAAAEMGVTSGSLLFTQFLI